MLRKEQAALVVIDVQGKLARLVDPSDHTILNIARMIRGAQVLGLPVVITEQYPEGIGPTVEEVGALLRDCTPLTKTSFSCCGTPSFLEQLQPRSQVLLTGIETHVCVYQTCRDLLAKQFEVHVVADAVASRSAEARTIALERMRTEGAVITTVEMALFEMVGIAEGDAFCKILRIVK
ncbi:hydrolase [Candidatus Fermentibacteria bacterium]|nr:hydrolase [Candidatus Fermentibacteria bacterium]